MSFSSIVFFGASHSQSAPSQSSHNFNSSNFTKASMSTQSAQNVVSSPFKKLHYVPEKLGINEDVYYKHALSLNAFKHMLMRREEKNPYEKLVMINATQRLAIDHLFQEEIEHILKTHYLHVMSNGQIGATSDLYEFSLSFRLLRTQGYYVPQEIFDQFKDEAGNFDRKIMTDMKGLMGLYEASQLGMIGEDKLDEARDHSYQLLSSWVEIHNNDQARIIGHSLKHPHHKSLSRFMATEFLSNFDVEENHLWKKVLKELAIVDFTMVQSLYHNEIIEISRWWKGLGLFKELKLARDQPVKWHMWSTACLTDPALSNMRIQLTKPITFIYLIDDIFDLYGTIEELTLFTDVINRWDIAGGELLPDYMKTCFNALDNITNEISYNIYKDHGWSPTISLRRAWASLCNAFLVEAKWFASGEIPRKDEYLQNGIVSSGVHVVLVHIFYLLGQNITEQNIKIIDNDPGIISSTGTILRLWDDLGSAKDENQDGHDGSYVECYLKEHQGSPVKDAHKHVMSKISESWKRLNNETLSLNRFSRTFNMALLNIARMVPLMYGYDDHNRLPLLEKYLSALL